MLARFSEQACVPCLPFFRLVGREGGQGKTAGPLGEIFGLSCVIGNASLVPITPIARGNEAGINLQITVLAIAYCRSRA